MGASSPTKESNDRFQRLRRYLAADPGNLPLLADTADAARACGAFDEADSLLDRYAGLEPLPPSLVNLKGRIALEAGRFDEAGALFEGLLKSGEPNPGVSFNLAWVRAMQQDYEATLSLLGDDVVAASPLGPKLKIQALHHLGRVEEAVACGLRLAEQSPHNPELMGSLALAALDADDHALARAFGERGRETHEGASVLGLLMLNDNRLDEAQALFGKALSLDPDDGRALLGQGLSLILRDQATAGVQSIDRAANVFQDHIGSWITSGWGHFVLGELVPSRRSFDRALALDENFAESHGALAVLDVTEGRIDEAQRKIKVAFRLDRNCLGATLAQTMLLNARGDAQKANRIVQQALNAPLDKEGRTLAQALTTFAVKRSNPAR